MVVNLEDIMKTSLFGLVRLAAIVGLLGIVPPVFAAQGSTVSPAIPAMPKASKQQKTGMNPMEHMKQMQSGTGMMNTQKGHMTMSAPSGVTIPKEGGQAGFAAIAEIVKILNDDPDTDWSKVNINRLRRHLVDMNELTLNAKAEMLVEGQTVTFKVTGTGRTLAAIQSMVIAHARVLAAISGWKVSGVKIADGATLTVVGEDKNQLTKIKALGFFGLMALGANHQPHHLGMATGKM